MHQVEFSVPYPAVFASALFPIDGYPLKRQKTNGRKMAFIKRSIKNRPWATAPAPNSRPRL